MRCQLPNTSNSHSFKKYLIYSKCFESLRGWNKLHDGRISNSTNLLSRRKFEKLKILIIMSYHTIQKIKRYACRKISNSTKLANLKSSSILRCIEQIIKKKIEIFYISIQIIFRTNRKRLLNLCSFQVHAILKIHGIFTFRKK